MTLTINWQADVDIVDAPGRPGSYCPETFTATWGSPRKDFQVLVRLQPGQGIVTSDIFAADEHPDDRRTMREVMRERVSEAIDGACWAVEQLTPVELSRRHAHKLKVAGKPSRPKLTDEHLAQIAETHRQNAGDRPTSAVARRFGLTQPNAAQRVALARRKGFLPPAAEDERVGASK